MSSLNKLKSMQVYVIFAISGATALIYQVIWSRWLTLVFGNTTISVSLILASFMSGLALGSWLAGRMLQRVGNPLRAYAFLELGIGIFALSFKYVIGLTDSVFAALISTETPFITGMAIRAFFACLLLLVPTTLMGATLPFLTEYFKRSPQHTRSWKVGLLYAANTFGAVVGIFLAGFLLIELLGISSTNILAALLNLTVAASAFMLARSVTSGDGVTTAGRANLDPQGVYAICVLTVSGALGLASEVLWTRTLESLVGNSTYAFSLIVLLYLVGIAAGSWLMSFFVNGLRNLPLWLATLQLGLAVWSVAAVGLFNAIAQLLAPYWGMEVSIFFLLWTYLKVMFVLLPLALLSGACFPVTTRIIDPVSEEADGALIAKAYSWNTIGAVFGSIAAGFLIAPYFDYLNAIYFLAVLYSLTAAGAYVFLFRKERDCRAPKYIAAALSVVTIAVFVMSVASIFSSSTFVDHINRKFPMDEVLSHRQGLQGITTVIRRKDQPLADRLLVNGMGMTSKVTDEKMMAHLPMLLHPKPADTLVICFGMGTTFRSAVSHGMNVTVVELLKEVLDAFDYYHDDASRVRAYDKGRMIATDGRNFLKLTRETYDVITIDPPPPIDAAGVNSLYTRELMQLARSRLKKGGIFAHWIPFPGMSGVDQEAYDLLVVTFADVFPYVYMKTGYNNFGMHIIGSLEPLNLAGADLKSRKNIDKIAKDILEWDPVPSSYFQRIDLYNKVPANIRLLTDDNPQLEFYLVRTVLQRGTKELINNYW